MSSLPRAIGEWNTRKADRRCPEDVLFVTRGQPDKTEYIFYKARTDQCFAEVEVDRGNDLGYTGKAEIR